MTEVSDSATSQIRQPSPKLSLVALFALTVGCMGFLKGPLAADCGTDCDYPDNMSGRVPPANIVASRQSIALKPEMLRGIAPGLRIFFRDGKEYYIFGPEVHRRSISGDLWFPKGVYAKGKDNDPYLRFDTDGTAASKSVRLDVNAVTEVYLVGLRGFRGLHGDYARAFLEDLAVQKKERTRRALSSMFRESRDPSFSLYTPHRNNVIIRFPTSRKADAPWQFGELIPSDFSPHFVDFRAPDAALGPLRGDVWVFHRDHWQPLLEVIGRATGQSPLRDKVYILLITDDFRSGETTPARRKLETNWWDNLLGSVESRDTPQATSYYQEFVGQWSQSGPQIRTILIKHKYRRVVFFGRSRIDGTFIRLNSIDDLGSESKTNDFLEGFASLDPLTARHLFSGSRHSRGFTDIVRDFLANRGADVHPGATILILDRPTNQPCALQKSVMFPGDRIRTAGVRVGLVNGFLTNPSKNLETLFAAALEYPSEGAKRCAQ